MRCDLGLGLRRTGNAHRECYRQGCEVDWDEFHDGAFFEGLNSVISTGLRLGRAKGTCTTLLKGDFSSVKVGFLPVPYG